MSSRGRRAKKRVVDEEKDVGGGEQRKPVPKEPELDDVIVSPLDGDVERRTLRTRAGFLLTLLFFLLKNPQHYCVHADYSPAQLAKRLGKEALEKLPQRLLRGWRGTWQISQLGYFMHFPKERVIPKAFINA